MEEDPLSHSNASGAKWAGHERSPIPVTEKRRGASFWSALFFRCQWTFLFVLHVSCDARMFLFWRSFTSFIFDWERRHDVRFASSSYYAFGFFYVRGIRLCPPLDLGFSVVLGLSTFAVSVTPPVLCAWRSTCSRYDKGWFRGKEVVVLGSTYGQPLRVPGDPEVDHFSANQGQTLVLKWVGIVRFSADWFGGHNIC